MYFTNFEYFCALCIQISRPIQILCNKPYVCLCMYIRVMNDFSLPAADDSLAGQRQVKESLAELEGQCIFQRLTINDQRQLIFLPQRVAQG